MKKFLLICAAVVSLTGIGGCTLDTPGYSAKERFAWEMRSTAYQMKEFNDDFDYALLLRPGNYASIWNIVYRP